jgi:hypothetical protein
VLSAAAMQSVFGKFAMNSENDRMQTVLHYGTVGA